jgi:hypothetical protein
MIQPDHEFPWVNVDMETREMHCTVCEVDGTTNDWLRFLATHQECADIWDYPRTLDEEA